MLRFTNSMRADPEYVDLNQSKTRAFTEAAKFLSSKLIIIKFYRREEETLSGSLS
jgi:hypothetical protein